MKPIIDYIKELRYELLKNDLLDNKLIDDRLLYEIINQQRALWIKNEQNKGRSIEDNVRQTINGIELQVADDSTFNRYDTRYRLLVSLNISENSDKFRLKSFTGKTTPFVFF